MRIEIGDQEPNALAVVELDRGEGVLVRRGALAGMSRDIQLSAILLGVGDGSPLPRFSGTYVALARSYLHGEVWGVQQLQATADHQRALLAPPLVGEVASIGLTEAPLTLQAGAYFASTTDVHLSVVWDGVSMVFGESGTTLLQCTGVEGTVLVHGLGGLERVEVDGSMLVDTGHLVAFQGDLTHRIHRPGDWRTTLLSGEGLVMAMEGQGTLWLQTRNVSTLRSWLLSYLPES